MSNANIYQVLISGILISSAAGLLGTLALLRRMALVGDAMSHIALPGIALGLLLNFNPFFGSLAFLVFGTVSIWFVEHKTKLPVDTLVGVFFALALAIGALLTPEEEILEALFGDITKISFSDFIIASVLAVSIVLLLLKFYKQFTLTMISPDLSLSAGYKPHQLELWFLLVFALIVALGIKFTGALLMGSLIIIPAATARNLAKNMKGYIALAVLFAVAGSVFGILFSDIFGLAPGPVFILFSGALFFLSILFKRMLLQ